MRKSMIVALLFAAALSACAQRQTIVLGESAVSLTGPWKFSPGDSPWVGTAASGHFLWAEPGFDDDPWDTMELRPAPGAVNLFYGSSGYIAGWSARGYPHLAGFAWYRMRLHFADPTQALALKMPDHVDDAYQVFANGQLIGQLGQFTRKRVICFRTQPLVFRLPPPDAHGDIELAIRFYMEPWVLEEGASTQSGGMHDVPIIGLPSVASSLALQQMRQRTLNAVSFSFVALLMLLVAGASLWLWALDRPRSTYLWLSLGLLWAPAGLGVEIWSQFSFTISQDTEGLLFRIAISVGLTCWIIFWRKWFGLGRNRRIYALLAGLLIFPAALDLWVFFFSSHSAPRLVLHVLELRAGCQASLCVLLLVTLIPAARRDRLGALLALPPILLTVVTSFSTEIIDWLGLPTGIFLRSGIDIDASDIAGLLLVLVLGVLVARRFLHSRIEERLEKQLLHQEMEQARELQQHVLIPEPVRSAVFAVQTAYHPARVVGGDFFQVILQPDGSLLIVVGDVSGKGMAAAMLVAVLVGSVRTRAEETADPAALLTTLNERLLGRADGHFATCLAAHLLPDGTMRLANAGHLPPYRKGEELVLPPALPLGVSADAEYAETTLRLAPNDSLTFLSDGVVEAQSPTGELFGFDRTRAIATHSAEAIAHAAQAFGQQDDITVLSLTFAPAEMLRA